MEEINNVEASEVVTAEVESEGCAPAVIVEDAGNTPVIAMEVEEDFDALVNGNVPETLPEAETGKEEPKAEATGQVTDTKEPTGSIEDVPTTQPNVLAKFSNEGKPGTGSLDHIELPAETTEVMSAKFDHTPNINIHDTEKQSYWGATVRQGLGYSPLDTALRDRLNSPTAKFAQTMEYRGNEYCTILPKAKRVSGTNEVEGETAILQLSTHLGIGAPSRVPMYNSGFWVNFKPALNSAFLELHTVIASDEVQLGRASYGLTLSNITVYSASRIFQLALQHVYSTSVLSTDMPTSDIPKYLKPQDFYSFIYGFLAACYPAGFQYTTGCINNPEVCQHVFEGVLDLRFSQVVDNACLTDSQKNFMSGSQPNSRRLDQVLNYQAEMAVMHDRRFVIDPESNHAIAITLTTPSMNDYLNQGMTYINAIVDSVNRSMEVEISNNARNLWMRDASNASSLCQYVHYVKEIEYGDISVDGSKSVIKDRTTIMKTLSTISMTDSIRERIIKEVLAYIGESTVSIIAIPAYDCPVCKKAQDEEVKDEYPRMKSYIPLDVVQLFFGLLSRRIQRIQRAG